MTAHTLRPENCNHEAIKIIKEKYESEIITFNDRHSKKETNANAYRDDLYSQGLQELGNKQGAHLSLIFPLTSRLAKSVHA